VQRDLALGRIDFNKQFYFNFDSPTRYRKRYSLWCSSNKSLSGPVNVLVGLLSEPLFFFSFSVFAIFFLSSSGLYDRG
jgi:hypothetical protein